jgi:hypothetical protein
MKTGSKDENSNKDWKYIFYKGVISAHFSLWKCKVHTEAVWGEVNVVTRLWAGKQEFWLIAGRGKRYSDKLQG